MARKSKLPKTQLDAFNLTEQLRTAPCVPAIRAAVGPWRKGGYKGVTETTRELLNFWFHSGHLLPNGAKFKFYASQQEAIETLVYLYEVAKIHSRKELLEKYAFDTRDLRLPPYDDFARYCVKMATGSGKTKVLALAIAWQYANAVREDASQFAKTFLLIAPNVIVFERLKTDFANGAEFRQPYLLPRHFQWWWDLQCYMRGDGERAHSEGALYLTNIQQFYERPDRKQQQETEIMTGMLGNPPLNKKNEVSDFDQRIARRDGLVMVLNDEAHHTHDEEGEWSKFIRRLHGQRPLALQLDVSATPRYSGGGLFAWTVFDYPLKQAILDGVVKRPLKGISKIQEAKSDVASVKYEAYLTAGVERWREYREQLQPLKKKPILFVMMNNTAEADDVADWLQKKYPGDFGGKKTLTIHTNRSGEVSKKDLDKARQLAKEVDRDKSPVHAIVSVLMLREGWDVQNVTVVVGLRPYSAKANILPEQTIGRGLRLMFRDVQGYKERVDIIGNNAFLKFVEDLEKLEGIQFDTFKVGKDKLRIITIQPDPEKMDRDIAIPEITPLLGRKKSLEAEIAAIDVMAFNINTLPFRGKDIDGTKTFIYEGYDILSKEKLLEREYEIPAARTPEEVIGYYSKIIAQNIKLPSQFAAIVPKVREFFEKKAFGKTVDLNSAEAIRAMSSNVASFVVVKEFEKILREKVVEGRVPELVNAGRRLSETTPFPTSRKVLEAAGSIFNYVVCDNDFEEQFARFLENAKDVEAFAKLPEQFNFCIRYVDSLANIRNYFPDYVARLSDGSHWLIETKGREDVEVIMKDNAAVNWCETASELTAVHWCYLKVLQKEFEKLHPSDFEELQVGLQPVELFD